MYFSKHTLKIVCFFVFDCEGISDFVELCLVINTAPKSPGVKNTVTHTEQLVWPASLLFQGPSPGGSPNDWRQKTSVSPPAHARGRDLILFSSPSLKRLYTCPFSSHQGVCTQAAQGSAMFCTPHPLPDGHTWLPLQISAWWPAPGGRLPNPSV